jgi:hypothetical protein
MTIDYGPILPAGTPRDGGENFRVPKEMRRILNQPGIQKGASGVRLLNLYAKSKFYLCEVYYVMTQFIASLAII